MDFESIKRLGLDYLGIDINNSFETYNPSNSNHTIFIHLFKQDEIICPLCGVINNHFIKGCKSQSIKYSLLGLSNIPFQRGCNHF